MELYYSKFIPIDHLPCKYTNTSPIKKIFVNFLLILIFVVNIIWIKIEKPNFFRHRF